MSIFLASKHANVHFPTFLLCQPQAIVYFIEQSGGNNQGGQDLDRPIRANQATCPPDSWRAQKKEPLRQAGRLFYYCSSLTYRQPFPRWP